MELLSAHGYLEGMARIIMILALVLTMSLKHFERTPGYVMATPASVSELTLASGLSATVVKATDCDDKYEIAGHPLQSHKSDCKAVIGKVAESPSAAFEDYIAMHDTSVVSTIRPVDLPPPRA